MLLLQRDKPESEREKIIVGQCEKIINSTPKLQYIETQLHFEFESYSNIERKIANFGKLHCKPLTAGNPCVFESTREAANVPSAGPKEVTLPSVELKRSAFDEKAKRLKLSFRLSPKEEQIEKHILDNMSIKVLCCEDKDDDDEKVNQSAPIHEQLVKFRDCKC